MCDLKRRFLAFTFGLILSVGAVSAQTNPIGFDDDGWNSDDTRDSSGTNIINSRTNSPGSPSIFSPGQVANQIDWVNFLGSRGNLGGTYLDTIASSSQKSTLSKIATTTTPLANGGDLISASFSASYIWQTKNASTSPPVVDTGAGLAMKFGVQSTEYSASQSGFSATRSGEGVWDLILVFDPTNNGLSASNEDEFLAADIDSQNGKFNVFAQAGNSYFSSNYDTSVIGVSSTNSRTLEEWNNLQLKDDLGNPTGRTWGDLLFDDGTNESNITNVQFGLGSGNQDAASNLDSATISFLNSGERIDFVDAARYNGTNSDYTSSANWDALPDNPSDPLISTAPSGTQNFIVDAAGTTDLTVGSSTTSRSFGVLSGTTNLTLSSGQTLTLSAAENGTLFVESGATANVSGAGTLDASVLESAGSLNVATETNLDGGANPHPIRDGSTTRYGIVVHSGGDMTLQNGADVTVSQNNLNVGVRVGGDGDPADGVATLTIEDGATLDIDSTTPSSSTPNGFFTVGAWGREGVVDQTGGTVNLTQTPGHIGSFNVGNQGGTGTYNLSGGSLNLGGGNHSLGRVRSGFITTPGSGTINLSGTGALTLNDTGFFVVGDRDGLSVQGDGTINQTGGSFTVANTADLYLGGFGNSTYNLEGGTLEIGGNSLKGNFGSATTPYDFNLQGGTIQVTGSDLNSSVDINVVDIDPAPGGFTISSFDTNGFNATLSGGISGGGWLAKTGSGTLNLTTNVNRSVLIHSVEGGGVDHQDGTTTLGALNVGAFPVVSGANSDGEFTLTDGTINFLSNGGFLYVGSGSSGTNTGVLNIDGGTLNLGDAGDPSVRVDFYAGAFDSTGSATVNQTGGTVNKLSDFGILHIGNQDSSNNIYNLSGGALNISGIEGMALGRSQTVAGEGTLNVSNTGTLTIDGTYLFLGGAQGSEPQTGQGTVNQTGGTVSLINGASVTLGRRGDGTYNLNGGTLEVGGNNGVKAGVGNATWNLGGGTLRVIESDLKTQVTPNLVGSTTSTVDTNSFNAVFENGLAGTGSFTKEGVGDMEIGGTTTLDGTSTVERDNLIVGSASAGAGTLNLNTGAALNVDSGGVGSGFDRIIVGNGGTGVMNIDGGSIDLKYYNDDGKTFRVGASGGTGTVNMTDGLVTVTEGTAGVWGVIVVGQDAGSTGTFNQSGGVINQAGVANLQVGLFGGTGTFTMSGDSEFIMGGSGSSTFFGGGAANSSATVNFQDNATFTQTADVQNFIALADSTAVFNQTGAGTSVTWEGDTGSGERPFWMGTGANGEGTYNLSAGSLAFDDINLRLGSAEDGTGILDQSGGSLTTPGTSFSLGYEGTGEYNLSAGTADLDEGLTIASRSTSTGTVDQTGGTVTIGSGSKVQFGAGTGTYNLDGGTLEVGGTDGIDDGSGTSSFSMGGGELQVVNSRLTTDVDFTVQSATTSTINVGSLGMDMDGDLGGSGTVRKTGGSDFVLNSDSSAFTGAVDVQDGVFDLQGQLGGQLTVESGSELNGIGTFSSLQVDAGGAVAPGNSIGTLSGQDMTWNTDDTTAGMVFELSNTDNDSDLISLSGEFQKGTGTDFLFDFSGTGFWDGTNDTIYTLVGFGSTTFTAGDFEYTNLASGLNATFNQNIDDLELIVVPELSSLSLLLLAGLTVFGATFLRRRQSRSKSSR